MMKTCIINQYPVILGRTLKEFMSRGVKIPEDDFMEAVLFLESCKGYEEDAKRFLFMTE
jgi:hypothetical protein